MEEMKKRKIEELGNGHFLANNLNRTASSSIIDELRALLDPLAKPQLVDLLSKLGSQYPFIAEEIKSVTRADPSLRKLFVRGLAWNTSSESLCAAFQEHGEIEEGAVIYDKATGKSRSYGFITYKDLESAQKALNAPNKMIDGRMAVCNLASEGLTSTSTTPDQAQRKLYVGGLSPETTSELLLSFFSKHGEIEEGSVAYDKDSTQSRGFGFVTYKTVEAAKKAIDDPQKMLGGRIITVKLADNNKGRNTQPQLPAVVVPVPVRNMAAGYQQNSHLGGRIIQPPLPAVVGPGYGYPHPPLPTYPTYPTHPIYPQFSPYMHYGMKQETHFTQTTLGRYPHMS